MELCIHVTIHGTTAMRSVANAIRTRIACLTSQHHARRFAVSVRAMSNVPQQEDSVEVCLLDPRHILQREKLQDLLANKSLYTSMKVPSSFVEQLSQGVMELGEMDDPMNSWYFGQKDEIFKYRLMGTHPTMSGFTCIIEQNQLAELCAGHETAGLPEWEDFKADLQAGNIHFPSIRTPFLFAGTVLDSPAAAVYQLKQDGKLVGIAISSEAVGA